MNIIPFSWRFEYDVDGAALMKLIESAGRTCYKSEERIKDGTADAFVRSIVARGHTSVIEHANISVRIICDRGVTHEIVRHRIASYSQESTRYCNYGDKNGGITVIDCRQHFKNPKSFDDWMEAMLVCERVYNKLLANGETPQIARDVLPNSLKTEMVMTMNLRSWLNFFKLRTAKAAHPQMRELAISMLRGFQEKLPVIFGDIVVEENPVPDRVFRYEAMSCKGEEAKGEVTAKNMTEAITLVREKGLFPTSVK